MLPTPSSSRQFRLPAYRTVLATALLLLSHTTWAGITATLDASPVLASTCDTPIVLPDILISESQPGQLAAGTQITLGSRYEHITRFDLSYATLTITRRDTGSEVATGTYLQRPPQSDNNASPDDIPDAGFQLSAPSTPQTGPLQWRLRGVLALINNSNNPVMGEDITLRIGISDGTPVRRLEQIQPFSAPDGSTPADLKIAKRVSASCPTWPLLRIGPLTAQQIVIPSRAFPASAPTGASYLPFVAAHFNGNWFALTPQRQWQAFTGCQDMTAALPVQSNTMPAIPLLPTATDLSTLNGLELWSGWGLAVSGVTRTEQACQNMLSSSFFSHIVTLP